MNGPQISSVLCHPKTPETLFANRPRMRRWLRRFGLYLVLIVTLFAIDLSDRRIEHIGDNVQIAVPLAGLACAVATGEGVRYFGRFVLLAGTYTASKRGLGELPINARPNGGYAGFPSGHTAATVFGASWLATSCLSENRMAQGMIIMTAALVGGSRIATGAHDVWQVLAGAFLGWMAQCLALSWFDRMFSRLWRGTGTRLRTGVRIGRIRIKRALRASDLPDRLLQPFVQRAQRSR